MRFFLAGIMQGSRLDRGIHSQDYRQIIREAIKTRYPEAEVVCPFEMHPASVSYDDETGKRTLLHEMSMAAEADGLIAYVPEASMGTAIEMWQAFQAGRPVWTISPLSANWVIRFLSNKVFSDLEEFVGFVGAGGMDRWLQCSQDANSRCDQSW
jgi:hypothetical protein